MKELLMTFLFSLCGLEMVFDLLDYEICDRFVRFPIPIYKPLGLKEGSSSLRRMTWVYLLVYAPTLFD